MCLEQYVSKGDLRTVISSVTWTTGYHTDCLSPAVLRFFCVVLLKFGNRSMFLEENNRKRKEQMSKWIKKESCLPLRKENRNTRTEELLPSSVS